MFDVLQKEKLVLGVCTEGVVWIHRSCVLVDIMYYVV